MSREGPIPGYTSVTSAQVAEYGLYNVPSYVPDGYSELAGANTYDRHDNMRANQRLLVSRGAGDGGITEARESGNTVCRPGTSGDLQFGRVQNAAGDDVGYYCAKPTPAMCPKIGGHPALDIDYDAPKGEDTRLATDYGVVCFYSPEAFQQPSSFDDWRTAFILFESPENAEQNQKTQDLFIMPNFCQQPAESCYDDQITGEPVTHCPRFVGDDDLSLECSAWISRGRANAAVGAEVDKAMKQYCARDENANARECQCIHAEDDELYNDLVQAASRTGVPLGDKGCWYAPCWYHESHLVPIEDECTLTELTNCSYYTTIYGNEGVVIQEIGGAIACSSEGVTPENPSLGEILAGWPWWAWLIVAVVVASLFLLIFWAIYASLNKGSSSSSVPAAPEEEAPSSSYYYPSPIMPQQAYTQAYVPSTF